MPCRVVHLTSVHPPFDTRIFHKECKSLAMAGYDVTLIAPHSEGDLVRDGVKLRAVTPPRDRRERLMHTVPQVYRAAVRENAEIYHFHDPELLPMSVLLRMRGKKVIYDVHEDYSGTMSGKKWLPVALHGPAAIAVRVCEAVFSAACNRVIAVTPKIAGKFRPGKTRVVQNFPWTHELRCSESLPYEKRDPVVVYVGGLADLRGLREMTQAIHLVAKKMPARLLIGGQVRSGAKAEFGGGGENGVVEYLGQLSRPQVAALLARARVGLVLHHPHGNYLHGQPTKVFEYMSAGLPVLASDFPVCRRVIEPAACGLLIDPLNPEAIAEALVWLLRNPSQAAEMGRNGQRAVAETYNWESESQRLMDTYAELQPAGRG
ncbi:MAG TPA: glycosyltransferase family 4 protein [Terriglobales bacterium]|jgi:glycosyltransferase involved in cell wall biosynthesis|nr:glycosyltransferase family 4 protein [Terriglobales bacterium]